MNAVGIAKMIDRAAPNDQKSDSKIHDNPVEMSEQMIKITVAHSVQKASAKRSRHQ